MDLLIDATATDADGNIATASVVVTVNTAPAPAGQAAARKGRFGPLSHLGEEIEHGIEHLRGHE